MMPRAVKIVAGGSAVAASAMAVPAMAAAPFIMGTAATVGSLSGLVLLVDGLIDDDKENA